MKTHSIHVLRAAAVALPLALGLACLGSAPVMAATPCSDLAVGKCTIQLSTGITMAYVETGPESGIPIILIHGYTDSIRSWSFAMAVLHKDDPSLRILAIELRGHGATSMPPAATCATSPEKCFRIADFANDVVAFMNAKNIKRAHLVGHSLGSFTVQEIALTHPEMVDHAVLVGTSAKVNPDMVGFVNETLGKWSAPLEAKGKKYPVDFYNLTPLDVDPNVSEWMANIWNADPAADSATLVPLTQETSRVRLGNWIGVVRANQTLDNTERLKQLTVPTLVIWGSQDSIFTSDHQNVLKQALEGASRAHGTNIYWKQYGALPLPPSAQQESDIGHMVQWDAPVTMAADIRSFVKTGEPTQDLPHSDKAPNISHILIDHGKAVVVRLGS
jgi:pimeloyl-ACP methyl ester carboxylesterase